ncbi:MAG: glycosyltransferase [Candidatus Auribacterota bacterium]|jgi:glycosyltransferase involved in cell wall biosynthesis|nr:glycosyltransferase [Candidatus Auribacterota bacterium]
MSDTFIVFSDDWGVHPSSCQHLFKRIARDNRVIWVNTVMRVPNLSVADLKKIFKKLFGVKQSSDDHKGSPVEVIRPFMVPFFNRIGRYINEKFIVRRLRRYMKNTDIASPVVVTTLPIVADVVLKIGAEKIVYYCVDEFSEWPGHNRQTMKNMESKLLSESDVVITTSQTLYESKKLFSKEIHCLPHGVDIEHFKPTDTPAPDVYPHPLLGYYGLFDERSDISLIEHILSKKPDWHIMVIGEARGDVSSLRRYQNMHFLGKIPYGQLPKAVHSFDICILPYKIDALTQNINPLKFKEYLATALPVVTTALPDLKQYDDVIGWARDNRQFVDLCEKFLYNETGDQRKQRLERTKKYLEGQSWEDKSQVFLGYIHNATAAKRSLQ